MLDSDGASSNRSSSISNILKPIHKHSRSKIQESKIAGNFLDPFAHWIQRVSRDLGFLDLGSASGLQDSIQGVSRDLGFLDLGFAVLMYGSESCFPYLSLAYSLLIPCLSLAYFLLISCLFSKK